jgi:hypothetical protein
MLCIPRQRTRDAAIILPPPTIDLDFTREGLVPPSCVFTRSTVGIRVKPDGLLEESNQDVPRTQFDPMTGECLGLLVEESRINRVPWSTDFSQANWSGQEINVVHNTATSPTGNNNASSVTPKATNGVHGFWPATVAGLANRYVTFSVWVKANGLNYIALSCHKGSTGPGEETLQVFDLTTGAVLSWYNTAPFWTRAERFKNGWWRLSITCRWNSANISTGVFCIPADQNPRTNWLGNAVDGVLVYGWQAETGYASTSYTRTFASAVTRGQDRVYSGFPANQAKSLNPYEGTIVTEFRAVDWPDTEVGSQRCVHEIANTADRGAGKVAQYIYEAARGITSEVNTTAYAIASTIRTPLIPYAPNTVAQRYRKRNYAQKRATMPLDPVGVLSQPGEGADITITGATRMGIGQFVSLGADSVLNGTIRRIRYWDRALGNDVLRRLAP